MYQDPNCTAEKPVVELPSVSAVIITHNRLDFLPNAIDSVKRQDYPNLIETIVVDDASTDGTIDYLESRDDIIKVMIPKEDSRGGNHARNVGISAAHGDYIAFLDDDDEWLPRKLTEQIKEIRNHPGSRIAGCRRIFRDDDGAEWTEGITPTGVMGEKVLYVIPYSTSALMVSKDLLLEVGCFDERLSHWQEYELEMRLLYYGNEIVCPSEPLVIYRVSSSDSKRLSRNLDKWETAVALIDEKHNNIIKNASKRAQSLRKYMIAIDGARRASSLRLRVKTRIYLFKAFKAYPTIGGFIKIIIGKPSLRPI